jgi:hypothetical protein
MQYQILYPTNKVRPVNDSDMADLEQELAHHRAIAQQLFDALEGMSELCGNYFDENGLVCQRDKEIWKQHLEAIQLARENGYGERKKKV